MKRQITVVLSLILTIVALGLYLHTKDTDIRAPLVFVVVAAALITFFSFAWGSSGSSIGTAFSDRVLRKAIASSIVVEYVVLVAIFAFWMPYADRPETQLTRTTELLLTHFTTIVGIVIAFYFGASAYVETHSGNQGSTSNDGGNAKSAQPAASGDAPPQARP